ncbi:DUF2442 domain-containing protein [Scytonema sp. UIC 10036]|uniref:DUF2442 domain-containing protein n=1 Tax=Scytonema sp. UIC 10036 TaxID=2304196 RepID=UPI001382CE73|nr:DUF2442 domain-containing protein [Scytonema sp. UIC 10036]
MLKDIVAVEPQENYQLRICFEDGVEGVVDISKIVKFTGVFAPLQNQEDFARVEVNREVGTIQWPSGADLDPDVLYAIVSKEPIPNYQLKGLGALESARDVADFQSAMTESNGESYSVSNRSPIT